jgi:hypothetical protein
VQELKHSIETNGSAMPLLFLNHSRANNAEAMALKDWLRQEGWDDVFLDIDPEGGIAANKRWRDALIRAARRCEVVLLVVSHSWLKSDWCLAEASYAGMLGKRLFLLLVEDISIADLPPALSDESQVVRLAPAGAIVQIRVRLPSGKESIVAFSKEGLTRLRHGLMEAGLDRAFFPWPPEADPHRPPYRGLRPFEVEDAGVFFGRDGSITEALDTLRLIRERAPPRVLSIVGASGVGKSSFLRAGLLPRLHRDDRNFLPLPVIRPQHSAINGEMGLASAIASALAAYDLRYSRQSIREAIAGGAASLSRVIDDLLNKASAALLLELYGGRPPALVLSIDQAEELFLPSAGNEAREFLELICSLVVEDRPAFVALFTIRSDKFSLLQGAPALQGIPQRAFPLPPLSLGEFKTVIEGPLERVADTGLIIDPQLTDRLLEEIQSVGGGDALGLIAFTMERLYLEYAASRRLGLAQYTALGGISHAITSAINQALVAADSDPNIPRTPAERLMLLRRGMIPWLVGISPEDGTPRRRIARMLEIPADSLPLIQLLVEQRVLISDRDQQTGEVTIEATDALLRQWDPLRGWLSEDRAALTVLEAVRSAARDWEASGCDRAWLNHVGGRLQDGEQIAARIDFCGILSPQEHRYLKECREREDWKAHLVAAGNALRELADSSPLIENLDDPASRRRIVEVLLSTLALIDPKSRWQDDLGALG